MQFCIVKKSWKKRKKEWKSDESKTVFCQNLNIQLMFCDHAEVIIYKPHLAIVYLRETPVIEAM